MTRKALLILAHGSKSALAEEELKALCQQLKSLLPEYEACSPAFLELQPPTLMQASRVLVEDGCDEIDVYPLFLNSGRHVNRDIPMQFSELNDHLPSCSFNLLPHFGANPAMAVFISSHLESLKND